MTKPNTRKFGQRIAELRSERGLSQQELALMVLKDDKTPVGGSTIAHIELGTEKLSRETCLKVVEALGVDNRTRKELTELLDKWLGSREKVNFPTFGKQFANIISDYSLELAAIARAAKTTASFAWYLKEGARLPGPEVLKKLVKCLSDEGVKREDITALERAYIFDAVFYTNPRLQYLPSNKRREAALAASQVIS